MKSYKFVVSGAVQGVYYRKIISEKAARMGFNGYIKNLSDGNVEAAITCEEYKVADFIEILKHGSPSSIVKNIEQYEIEEEFSHGFVIRY